jgi:hypothetical protein
MVKPISLANVKIGFRNFEGREGMYNKAGERSFAVFLDRQTADELTREGWNVKYPREIENADPDADSRDPYIQVSVGFEKFPPKVILMTNGNPARLTEDEVGMLDWAELEWVDLVLRPYEWSVNRNSGVKAYLKSGYFTIVTDAFTAKYGV